MKQYIVKTDYDKIKLFDEWNDVIHELKVRTFEWCLDPNYEGENHTELFDNCLSNKDFGDIASVYECEGSFYSDDILTWEKLM